MGLLTDPSSGQGKLTKFLLKFYAELSVLLYLVGAIWFCSLASPSLNASTYFSENALLPGLVKSMFQEDRTAMRFYEELLDEAEKYESSIPYSWLLAKFRQIGLDTYSHNFTLHSPLSRNEMYFGRNVYGILRAPRASSTEALVLSVPYRPPSSIYPTTLPSVAVAFAFAKYAIREKYWAKDIIFLITDHEQLGMQAWLEAYHGVTCGNADTLDHGDLKGRAGAIQAAINLEIHSVRIGHIDIKIEGLNGQLPNLDLFNLAGKICVKEGVFYTFKGKASEYHRDAYKEWIYYFKNLLMMMGTQASGIPNGNHGLFLRFGIQALTLEGFEQSRGMSKAGFVSIGRVIEGIFRSMNNLLERFHQSFFFYLLPSADRYISIGLYMPAACLIAAAVIIKSCAKWCKLQETWSSRKNPDVLLSHSLQESVNYIRVVILFVTMHLIGIFLMALPMVIMAVADASGFDVGTTVFSSLIGVIVASLLSPFTLKTLRSCSQSMNLLCIFSLLELGTVIICLSMNNFSLGIFCASVSVPFALIIEPTTCRYHKIIQRLFWVVVHPLVVLFMVVLLNTYFMFAKDGITEIVVTAFRATQQAVIYSIVDSMIYGNWLYTVVTAVLIPNWLCFWCISCSTIISPRLVGDKKTD